MQSTTDYPRDMVGYGRHLPDPQWPGGARLAILVTINYEAGGESNILHGDEASEGVLSDTPIPALVGERSVMVESSYEFGSRRGIWRLFDLVESRGIHINLFGVVMALERNPEVASVFAEAGHEIVAHGYRWIDHRKLSEEHERSLMQQALDGIERLTGERPVGWMTGRPSLNTRRLVVEAGLRYDRDALNDELPYWVDVEGKSHLVIPYSYDVNDMRYGEQGGFVTGEHFYSYLKESFDTLYSDGRTAPRMMSIGLHDRIAGRPGRAGSIARFLDYALERGDVWFCTGREVADHWRSVHPA